MENEEKIKNERLEGMLFKLVLEYDDTRNKISALKELQDEQKQTIMNFMKRQGMTKVRNHMFSVSLKRIQPNKRIADKKLKEMLFAKGFGELWDKCLYAPDSYEQLYIKKIKGGEETF